MPKKVQRFSTEDTKEETHTQQKSLSYSEIVGNLTDDQTVYKDGMFRAVVTLSFQPVKTE